MANDWKLTLGVEAMGHDDHHVTLRHVTRDRAPYVVVRVGSVIAHCLGPAAVGSGAQAWAAAQARVIAGDLPMLSHEAGRRPLTGGREGAAVPCGSVVFDGAQPWSVTISRDAGTLVTIGCLQVRVRDWTALDVHVRAWAQAMDLAVKAFPDQGIPFSRMVSNARFNELDRGVGIWQAREDGPERDGPRRDR